jgi:hypothetical protein
MVLFFQIIVNPNLSYAKPIDTLGRVFNVQDFIDASGADDELGIKRCLTTAAMQNHNQVKAHITILFPARVYQISGSLYPVWNLNEKAFYMRPDITNHIGRYAQINILGLTVDNATLKSDLGSMISGSFQTYINGTSWVPYDTSSQANYLPLNYHNYGYTTSDSATEIAIKNYINSKIGQTTIQHNVSTPVSSATFLTMPNPTIAVEIQSNNPNNHHFFVIDGAGKAGTSYYPGTYVPNPVYGLPSIPPSPPNNGELYNTAINIAGFRLKGIDTGNNSHIYSDTLIQHDSTFNMGKAICLEDFKSYFIDNNIIEDVYGSGINISNKMFSYINGPVEVHHNLIKNVWGLVYKPTTSGYDYTGDGINFQGLKDGICQYNIVNNDVSITKQFGRIGIGACSEHTMNTECSYNMVSGYDRGIHIENGLGGYKIHHNRLTGSETGIVFDGNPSYRDALYLPPDDINYHQCPFINPSHIHHNYISNVPDVPNYNSNLIKLYLPELIWASHANASNEHRGTIIEDNEMVIDKEYMYNYVPCNTTPLLCKQTRLITPNQQRFHIQSGLREQKILCNEFKVLNSAYHPTFPGGGTALYSECGRINYQEPQPSCIYTPDPVLPNHLENEPASSRLIFDLQFNNYIDCKDPLWMMWVNDSPEQQARIAMNTFTISPPCSSNMSLYNSISFYTNTNSNTNISCCRQPNQLGMQNLYNTKASYGHYALSNETFFVNGTYTIDQSTTFTNCTFYLATNAKITVAAGQTLTLNGCTLKAGCNAMWDGIYASDPSAEIIINGGTLQDMENGVVLTNNAKINSNNVAYQDNYTSIQLHNITQQSSCVVENNSFKKVNGLLAPYVSLIKPKRGIKIVNCTNISIGDLTNPSSANTFDEMWNGIYIECSAQAKMTSSAIGLYHNIFNNIIGDATTWGNKLTTATGGWAVFAFNGYTGTNMKVSVKGDPSFTSNHFTNCDKGILMRKASSEILNTNMDNTAIGVLLSEANGRAHRVLYNNIKNTELGIAKYGDENSSGFYANWNQVSLVTTPTYLSSTTGILSSYTGTTHTGVSYVQNNNIEIPAEADAVGISMFDGNKDYITGNMVHLTSNSTANGIVDVPNLIGIYSNNNLSPVIFGNVVDNNFSINGNTNFVQGNNAGIYLNKSEGSVLQCNSTNYTQYGMFGVDKSGSTTDYDLTAGNTMRCEDANFMFLELVNDGSFGQVGIEDLANGIIYDANNIFLQTLAGTPYLSKVYRFSTCSTAVNDQIVTTANKLNASLPGESESNGPCPVDVYNPSQPFTQTFNCATNSLATLANIPNFNIEYNHAMEIALNEIEYVEFDEGAQYANEQLLFAWLEANAGIRANSPILDSFYLANMSDVIGGLNIIENLFTQINDSSMMADTSAWNALLQNANTQNNNLANQVIFETNAKYINQKYLTVLQFGIDSLSEEDIEQIEMLANTCPYLGGNAVYRARSILGMLNPGIHYDDLVICNSQGVYKNGTSKLQNWLASLAELKEQKLNRLNDELIIYPNPAHNELFLKSYLKEGETATFIIFDLTGEIQLEFAVDDYSLNMPLDISSLKNGLYLYSYRVTNGRVFYGKLIVD